MRKRDEAQLLKLQNLGMTSADEAKLTAMRDYILKLASNASRLVLLYCLLDSLTELVIVLRPEQEQSQNWKGIFARWETLNCRSYLLFLRRSSSSQNPLYPI
jgi:hypothetical protein